MPNTISSEKPPLRRADLQTENLSWVFIYGFFLLHMLIFGSVGFLFAYSDSGEFGFNLAFSGFAIAIYSVFYLIIFGLDEIKWLVINSAIGILGIVSQLDWILGWFGKSTADFPPYIHIVPGIYFVLYTFLLRRAVLHVFKAQDGSRNKMFVDIGYVVLTVGFYLFSLK